MGIIEESFRIYWGTSEYWLLYVVALAFILYCNKDKHIKSTLGWYALVVLMLILNPLFLKVMRFFADSTTTYVRVYYLLPVVFTIAYAVTIFIYREDKKMVRMALLIIACVMIAFSGKSFYERDAYRVTENIYKIPEEQITLAEFILDDIDEDETAYILANVWDPNWTYIRQYTSRIVSVGTVIQKNEYKDPNFTCQGDVNLYINYMDNEGPKYDYLIVENVAEMLADYVSGGHILLGETDNYAVIKVVHQPLM